MELTASARENDAPEAGRLARKQTGQEDRARLGRPEPTKLLAPGWRRDKAGVRPGFFFSTVRIATVKTRNGGFTPH